MVEKFSSTGSRVVDHIESWLCVRGCMAHGHRELRWRLYLERWPKMRHNFSSWPGFYINMTGQGGSGRAGLIMWNWDPAIRHWMSVVSALHVLLRCLSHASV